MKHYPYILATAASALLLISCSDHGMSAEGQIHDWSNFDPNTVQTMRLSTLREPMVWGGYYTDPGMDSIIPGVSRQDSVRFEDNLHCSDKDNWERYVEYVPLYQDADIFLQRIKTVKDEVPLLNPGKLMVSGNWKFVTDVNRGIHIYDDTDPANPRKIAFLYVPGVLDIALKNKMLYANVYSGLVTIDIENPQAAKAIHMLPNAFPSVYNGYGSMMDSLGNVAVAWRADTVSRCVRWRYEDMMFDGSPAYTGTSADVDSPKGVTLGQNASMSRFAISADWLYTVDYTSLRLFDIRSERHPSKGAIVETSSWDLETIFKYKNALFLGSMTGMLIYDHSAGGIPLQASTYSHITSCDPVVVQDDIAYVTLRSGQRCRNGKNELNVIDVSDIYKPELLATYPMSNPAGLAVEDSTLFVCEESYGLAVLDIQDPKAPREISRVDSVKPEDVIASGGILTLIGSEGIWRLDYSDRKNLVQLSFTESEAPEVDPATQMQVMSDE